MAMPMSPSLVRIALKKTSTPGHTPAKRLVLSVTPSLMPRLHMPGTRRAGQSGLARSVAAAVLVNDDAAQRLHPWRHPHRVVDGKHQFTGIGGSFVAHPIVGRISRRKDIVGRPLGAKRIGEGEQEDEK